MSWHWFVIHVFEIDDFISHCAADSILCSAFTDDMILFPACFLVDEFFQFNDWEDECLFAVIVNVSFRLFASIRTTMGVCHFREPHFNHLVKVIACQRDCTGKEFNAECVCGHEIVTSIDLFEIR